LLNKPQIGEFNSEFLSGKKVWNRNRWDGDYDERSEKQEVVDNSRYYPGIKLYKLRKATRNLTQLAEI
jgi:hypothetical protein